MMSFPSSAKHVAVTRPTYPAPNTAIFIAVEKNKTYLNILPFILLYTTYAKKKISITINEKTLQGIRSIIDNVYIRTSPRQ